MSLDAQFETACNLAAKLYAEGRDTTEIDAEVDRLLALIETRDEHVLAVGLLPSSTGASAPDGEETSMSTMQDLVQAEITARELAEKNRIAEARERRRDECAEKYTEFFAEPPAISRERIEGTTYLIASGHGFRFAWHSSQMSGHHDALCLIRTCQHCGEEWVSEDYLYVIDGDIRRQGSTAKAVAKRLAEMHTSYVRKHECEERARLAAKAGVRTAASMLKVDTYEIVRRLASDWAI